MRLATTLTAFSALLVLTACGGGDKDGADLPSLGPVTPDPCTADPNSIPVECVTPNAATPTGSAPAEGSSFYKAVKILPIPDTLFQVGNDVDVTKTSATATVTVKAGYRLGAQAVCEGRTKVTTTTVPDSGAGLEFTCGFEGIPSEIGAADPKPVTKDTTYQLKVTVPAPARWYVTFYETKAAVPPS